MDENTKNKLTADIEELIKIEVPTECNLQLPDPVLLNIYRLQTNRIIEIRKDIDESLFNEIQQIILWNMEDEKNGIEPENRKPVKCLIHSYGGDMFSCLAFIDIMKMSKTKIWTFGMQAMMSAAALIFINGHKRYTSPLSTLLLHAGSGQVAGDFNSLQSHNENYKHMVDVMKKNVEEHSTMSKQKLAQVFKKESFFYAEDQVKNGLADEIWTDMSLLFK